jgi:transmembrane sensor
LGSGAFTATERAELAVWRSRSPEHEAAFRQASALGCMVREVGREMLDERRQAFSGRVSRRSVVGRRAVLTGAAAAAAGVVAADWNRLSGLFGPKPDYVTGVGERRTLRLAQGLTVDLDAETSLAVARGGDEHRITLLGGRAVIDADLRGRGLTVAAGKGRIRAEAARFDIEVDRPRVCVTCVQGDLQVVYGDQSQPLGPRGQLVYTDAAMGRPASVDSAAATAWTKGQLIFHETPLAEVVRQVNRYRASKVVIANPALERRTVNGVFYISRMPEALLAIEQATGARRVALPGGVVIFT